jgi:hypothetical protein
VYSPTGRDIEPSVGQGAAGFGDDESPVSPAGAARAEREDEEAVTANDARSREELDGSFMANSALEVMI